MGIVLPSLREETCLKILEGTVNINIDDWSSVTAFESGTQTNVLTSMVDVCSDSCDIADEGIVAGYNNDRKYVTTGINLNIGDIITEDIENDDWCTNYDHEQNMMTI